MTTPRCTNCGAPNVWYRYLWQAGRARTTTPARVATSSQSLSGTTEQVEQFVSTLHATVSEIIRNREPAALAESLLVQAQQQLAGVQTALDAATASNDFASRTRLAGLASSLRVEIARLQAAIASASAAPAGTTPTNTGPVPTEITTVLAPVAGIGAAVVGGSVTGLIMAWITKGNRVKAMIGGVTGDLLGRTIGVWPGALSTVGAYIGAKRGARKPVE